MAVPMTIRLGTRVYMYVYVCVCVCISMCVFVNCVVILSSKNDVFMERNSSVWDGTS